MKVLELEGIGPAYSERLGDAGVQSVEKLLERGRTRAGRTAMAKASGIEPKLVLEWVDQADLMRVKGVGPEYSDLLEASGVDTVPELAHRNPAHLTMRLAQVNATRHIVRRLPSEHDVVAWIEEAKTLGRTIEY